MTQCIYFDNCPANLDVDSRLEKPMSVIEYYHRTYCHGNPSNCARFKVRESVGKEELPSDLLPYQQERAEQIINNN